MSALRLRVMESPTRRAKGGGGGLLRVSWNDGCQGGRFDGRQDGRVGCELEASRGSLQGPWRCGALVQNLIELTIERVRPYESRGA